MIKTQTDMLVQEVMEARSTHDTTQKINSPEYNLILQSFQKISSVQGSFSYKHLILLEKKVYQLKHSKITCQQHFSWFLSDISRELSQLKNTILNEKSDQNSDIFIQIEKAERLLRNEKIIVEDLQKLISRVKQGIYDFNICQFSSRLQIAESTCNKIKDQEGLVFIGATGSGKTTTVLSLLGHFMIRNETNPKWIVPRQRLTYDPDIDNLISHPGSRSVTRNVTAVELQERMIDLVGKKNFYLIDTPGFQDREGSIKDLQNSYISSVAIKTLKKVSFAVVISKDDVGSRYQGFQQIIIDLNELFPDFQSVKTSLNFIFIKFDQKSFSEQSIEALKDLDRNCFSRLQNNNFVQIINHIILQCRVAKVFDPIQKDIRYLKLQLQPLISCQYDNQKQNIFPIRFTSIIDKLKIQFKKHTDLIDFYIKREQISVAMYLYTQIIEFMQIISLKQKQVPAELTNELKYVQKNVSEVLKDKCLKIKNKLGINIEKCTLKIEHIEHYTNFLETISLFKKSKYTKIKNLVQHQATLLKDKKQHINNFLKTNFFENYAKLSENQLKTYVVFFDGFNLHDTFKQLNTFIKLKQQDAIKNYEEKINLTQFDKSVPFYLQYQSLIRSEAVFYPNSSNQNINQIDKAIITIVKNYNERTLNKDDLLSKEYVDSVIKVSQNIKKLQQSTQFLETVSNKVEIIDQINLFKDTITVLISQQIVNIRKCFEGTQRFNEIKRRQLNKQYKLKQSMQKIWPIGDLVKKQFLEIDKIVQNCSEKQLVQLQNMATGMNFSSVCLNNNNIIDEIRKFDEKSCRVENVILLVNNQTEFIEKYEDIHRVLTQLFTRLLQKLLMVKKSICSDNNKLSESMLTQTILNSSVIEQSLFIIKLFKLQKIVFDNADGKLKSKALNSKQLIHLIQKMLGLIQQFHKKIQSIIDQVFLNIRARSRTLQKPSSSVNVQHILKQIECCKRVIICFEDMFPPTFDRLKTLSQLRELIKEQLIEKLQRSFRQLPSVIEDPQIELVISNDQFKNQIQILNQRVLLEQSLSKIIESNGPIEFERFYQLRNPPKVIENLFQRYDTWYQNNQGLSNIVKKACTYAQKCKSLNFLSHYYRNINFDNLRSLASEKIKELKQGKLNSFSQLFLQEQPAQDLIVRKLQTFSRESQQLYEEAEWIFKDKVEKNLSTIKKMCKDYQPSYQKVLQLAENYSFLQQLFKLLEENQILSKKQKIVRLLQQMQNSGNHLKTYITLYSMRYIKQAENNFDCNFRKQAQKQLKDIKKIEQRINIQSKEFQSLNRKVQNKLNEIKVRYNSNEQIDFNHLKVDYELVAQEDQTIVNTELGKIKRNIINKVVKKIDLDINSLELNESKMLDLRNFTIVLDKLNSVPHSLRQYVGWDHYKQHFHIKKEKWENHIKDINQKINDVSIFQNNQINALILEIPENRHVSDKQKSICYKKIDKQLHNLLNRLSDKSWLNYTKSVFTCKQLKYPKNAHKNITSVFDKIYQKISKQINQLFLLEVNSKCSIFQQNSVDRLKKIEIELEQMIQHMTIFSQILIQKGYQSLSNLLKDKIQDVLCDFQKGIHNKLPEIDYFWNTYLHNKSNNSRSILHVFQENKQLKKSMHLLSSQLFVNSLIKVFKTSNGETITDNQHPVCEQITKMNKSLLFELSKIKQLKFYDVNEISIFKQMDQHQITRFIDNLWNQCNYFDKHLRQILFVCCEKEIENKVERYVETKVRFDNEIKKISDDINKYLLNITSDEKQVDKVRKHIMIVHAYSKFQSQYKDKKQEFIQSVQNTHKQLFDLALTTLTNLQLKRKQFENRQKDQNKIESQEKKRQTNLQVNRLQAELEQRQQFYQNTVKDQSNQQKQKTQKGYLAENQSRKTISKETIQAINNFFEEQATIRKTQFSQIQETDMRIFGTALEKMAFITDNFLEQKREYVKKNNQLIEMVKKDGKKSMQHLYNILKQVKSTSAQKICSENCYLKLMNQTFFYKNIKSYEVEEAVKLIFEVNDFQDKKEQMLWLKKSYLQCFKQYQTRIKSYQKDQKSKVTLIKNIIREKKTKLDYSQNYILLGKILAIWSIINSFEEDCRVVFNYSPHIFQILAILFLLKKQNKHSRISSRFAEIQTGQGKSLILAVMAVYLALKGFQVDVVCYSEVLSKRDRQAFDQLFVQLELSNSIKYCTFNDLTERFLNYKDTSFRKQSQEIMHNKSNINSKQYLQRILNAVGLQSRIIHKQENKILLMDEADVFFINQFYGNLYPPVIDLKAEEIKNLYRMIWRQKDKQPFTLNKLILDSDQFKQLIIKFPHLVDLLKNQVGYMINGVKNYQHEYVINGEKIKYLNQDSYSQKISYGYKTVFAYFYELGKDTIKQLPELTSSIQISLGKLSYAEIPKMYSSILGVTGTLSNLSDCKKDIMRQKYEISQNLIIPSVYPTQNAKNKGYLIAKSKDIQYDRIIQEINQQIALERPVMVFFETPKDLETFFHSPICQNNNYDIVILNQNHSQIERKIRIRRAMGLAKISLITKAFARGTDFIIYDQKVIGLGGAYLIVTYIPESKSEEVQILGRVARQGDPGQSKLIVTLEELKNKTGLQASDLNPHKNRRITDYSEISMNDISAKIDNNRQQIIALKHYQLKSQIQKCQVEHKKGIQLYEKIISKQFKDAETLIIQMNQLPEISFNTSVKTVLAIDGTYSMKPTLDAVKRSLSQCFLRVYRILSVKKVNSGFDIQIVVYRNYNLQQNQLIEVSPPEIKPQNLIKFIKDIQPKGGWGSQALEIVFDYCQKIKDLNQIIIITDAEGNTFKQVQERRQNTDYGFGEKYWKNTVRFKQPINPENVLENLRKQGVVIHSLPIGIQNKGYYNKICQIGANNKSGKCQVFDPTSLLATDELTDFISKSILLQLEGINQGMELVKQYENVFKRRYRQ